MSFIPDLDAYFSRIGHGGGRAPTLETLNAIVRAHITRIPFENLDVLLGKGVDLDPAVVEQKLVHARRGGYCFEQNSHLLRVLQALGYDATPLSGRVRVGRARDYLPARTHVFVRVMLEGRPWIADVGVGALSPTCALRFDTAEEQATPHEPRRFRDEGPHAGLPRRIFHQVRFADGWHDVCELTGEEMPEIDREVGNWFTSKSPKSHFLERLIVARASEDGRVVLLNRELSFRDRHGVATTRVIDSPAELLAVMAEHFGLVFPAGTEFPCAGLVW